MHTQTKSQEKIGHQIVPHGIEGERIWNINESSSALLPVAGWKRRDCNVLAAIRSVSPPVTQPGDVRGEDRSCDTDEETVHDNPRAQKAVGVLG